MGREDGRIDKHQSRLGRQLSGGCGLVESWEGISCRAWVSGLCVSFFFLLWILPRKCGSRSDTSRPTTQNLPGSLPRLQYSVFCTGKPTSAEAAGERLPRSRRAEAQQPHLKQAKRSMGEGVKCKCSDRACVELGPAIGKQRAAIPLEAFFLLQFWMQPHVLFSGQWNPGCTLPWQAWSS